MAPPPPSAKSPRTLPTQLLLPRRCSNIHPILPRLLSSFHVARSYYHMCMHLSHPSYVIFLRGQANTSLVLKEKAFASRSTRDSQPHRRRLCRIRRRHARRCLRILCTRRCKRHAGAYPHSTPYSSNTSRWHPAWTCSPLLISNFRCNF